MTCGCISAASSRSAAVSSASSSRLDSAVWSVLEVVVLLLVLCVAEVCGDSVGDECVIAETPEWAVLLAAHTMMS